MKRFILAFAIVSFFVGNIQAQNPFSGIGANLGTNFLVGDSPIIDSKLSPNLGVYGIYDYSSKLKFKLQIGYGKMSMVRNNTTLTTSMVPIELIGMYSLSKFSSLFPFVHAGIGAFNFSINGSPRYNDGMLIGGAGFNLPVGENLTFMLSADMRYTSGDDFNGYTGGLGDGYFSLQAGLTYSFSKEKKQFKREEKPPTEKLITEKPSVKGKTSRSQASPVSDQDIYLQIVQLKSRVEQLENELLKKDAQIQELKTLVKIKDDKIGLLEAQVAEYKLMAPEDRATRQPVQRAQAKPYKPAQKSGETKANNAEIKQRYKLALQQFNARNYRAAIQILSDLYKNYPQHRLASNFVYWMGESYYAMGKYAAAAEAFNNVLKYSRSYKLDDALLMAGLSYLKLGDPATASQKFQTLLKKFPNSEFAGKAKRYLQKIQREIIS